MEAIQVTVTLGNTPVEAFQEAYRALESQWKKYIDAHGKYIEKY